MTIYPDIIGLCKAGWSIMRIRHVPRATKCGSIRNVSFEEHQRYAMPCMAPRTTHKSEPLKKTM